MSADIDIDFADREAALQNLKYVRAARTQDGRLVSHNTGVYLQDIPHNPITNLATIDYKEADTRGYFKLDFLNVSLYKDIRSEEHLVQLMAKEPLWDLLKQDDFSNLLFHVSGYGSILRKMEPKTVEQLAAVLAMIRPAKKHLIGKSWNEVMKEVWVKPENDDYFFKKAHAVAYAVAIVVQMNLICEQVSVECS